MPFKIVRNDISKMKVDVIVNSTFRSLTSDSSSVLSFGGAEARIMSVGGTDLVLARNRLGNMEVTESKLTPGYNLPCNYVVHTVGPDSSSSDVLRKTYRNVFNAIKELDVESIAFPLISTGLNGFSKYEALLIAEDEINKFLEYSDMTVYLVVYDEISFSISKELKSNIDDFLHNVLNEEIFALKSISRYDSFETKIELEDSFVDKLIQYISKRGEKDSVIYKRANIDRRHFSKMKNDSGYHPSKNTVFALAIGLVLTENETIDLLESAGYSLSKSIQFDQLIKYCIQNEIYNIHEVNNILFDYGEECLGTF